MLGQGRPFILEFVNPKKVLSCRDAIPDLQRYITSSVVYCHQFQLVTKKFFDELKEIENLKAKSYCCVVWVKRRITKKDCEMLNSLENIKVD